MKKNDYKQIKERAKENENCSFCSLRRKCPFENRNDCMDYNSQVLKSGIE